MMRRLVAQHVSQPRVSRLRAGLTARKRSVSECPRQFPGKQNYWQRKLAHHSAHLPIYVTRTRLRYLSSSICTVRGTTSTCFWSRSSLSSDTTLRSRNLRAVTSTRVSSDATALL